MLSKFIAMDNYPLDISRAYVHKTFVGGVFSIIYASLWIALTVSIIVKYFQSPDVLNSHLISGIDQQYSRPNFSLVTVKSKLILQDHDAQDLKDFFNYFLFAFMYRESASSLPKTQFIECDFTDGESCQFSLSLKNEYFSISSDDYPSINLISCTDFKTYRDKGLIIIDGDDSLLTKCTGDVSEVYSKPYIGSKFVYDITMPFYSLTKKYIVNVNDKVYETMFKVKEALPDKYVFEQIKIQTEYSNYFFFGSKNTSTYINWRYPDKDGISLYLSNNYQYTIVFSSRNGDIMWYYEVSRGSLLTILIELGGLLKFVGLFLYLPMIWNKYFRQKALLTLNNFFERNSMMNESNDNSNSQITTNSKEEKLTVKTNQEIDWKKMTFTEYFCSKLSKFWCCCCSKSKKLRAERRKGLSQLESASFIRFGFDGKWVDIRSYFPGYTNN